MSDSSTIASAPLAYRGQIPELNALRAFGLTMVILAHTWPHESVRVWNVLQLAWTLMDAFFVLSGFLITGILLDSRSRPDYYRSYYVRRALRILPVYYLLIGVLTFGSLLGQGYRDMLRDWGSPWWFFVYLGNVPTALKGVWPLAARGSYVPLWSLQVEEQFYLLLPLLIHKVRLTSLARSLLIVACLSPIIRVVIYLLDPSNTPAQYVLLPCRMEGLAFGAWIAVRCRLGPWNISKRRLTVMSIALLAVTYLCAALSGYAHTTAFNRTIGFLLSPLAWAHVVLWLILFRGSRLTACLRLSAVQHLGQISYTGYLFHWPLAAAIVAAAGAVGADSLRQGYLKVIAVYVVTIACASLSWRYFEAPILNLKHRLSGSAARQVTDQAQLVFQRSPHL